MVRKLRKMGGLRISIWKILLDSVPVFTELNPDSWLSELNI
jgi:hypothetical protein